MIGDLSHADLIERRQLLLFDPIISAIDSGISSGAADAGGVLSSTAADAAATAAGDAGGVLSSTAADAMAAGAGGLDAAGALSGAVDPLALALGDGLSGGGGALSSTAADAMAGGAGGAPVDALPGEFAQSGNPEGGMGMGTASGIAAEQAASAPLAAPRTAAATGRGISNTALALGALAMLGSAFGKPGKQGPYNASGNPGPSSTAATQGPLFNAPLNPHGFVTRTPTTA